MAQGYLGPDATNNIAEYEGLLAAMSRANGLATPSDSLVFEVDSNILARQLQVFGIGKFACRSESLKRYFLQCVRLGWDMSGRGIAWRIRHIYREFNQTADSLANMAIDIGSSPWDPPTGNDRVEAPIRAPTVEEFLR